MKVEMMGDWNIAAILNLSEKPVNMGLQKIRKVAHKVFEYLYGAKGFDATS